MMEKIVEYKVLENQILEALEKDVNEFLKQGFELYGNLSTSVEEAGGSLLVYYQTMVKRENPIDSYTKDAL